MSERERQHYVAQMYLRGFLDPAKEAAGQYQLWLYQFNRMPRLRATTQVAWQRTLYNLEDDEERDWIEKELARFESNAAVPLSKLRAGRIDLTSEERSEMAGFIALTLSRTPYFFRIVNRAAVETYRQWSDYRELHPDAPESAYRVQFGNWYKGIPDLPTIRETGEGQLFQTERRWTLSKLFESAHDLCHVFGKMQWILLEPQGNEFFVATDNPVVLQDERTVDQDSADSFEGSPFTTQFRFVFPINRRHVLFGRCRKGVDEIRQADGQLVTSITRACVERADTYVYSPYRSASLQDLVDEKLSKPAEQRLGDLPDGFLEFEHFL